MSLWGKILLIYVFNYYAIIVLMGVIVLIFGKNIKVSEIGGYK